MDDDQFNDFEQAVDPSPETPPQNTYKDPEHVQEQTNLAENNSSPIDPPLINPSSCLAVQPIQSSGGDIEIKELEGSSQPHLNKIRSENLTTSEDVFFNLDKNYSHSEPNIELIDYTNVNFTEDKNLFNEILGDKVEDGTFQNLENTNLDLKNKIQNDDLFNENPLAAEHNLYVQKVNQSDIFQNYGEVEYQVKENQQMIQNYEEQDQDLKHQILANSNNYQYENNQITQQERQQLNTQQKDQQKQPQKQKVQQDEDDQFGDFEQTIPNTEYTNDIQTYNTQNTQQNQVYQAQTPQYEQPAQVLRQRTRKQQLEQFVNSLPDYSFLFVQTFQSF